MGDNGCVPRYGNVEVGADAIGCEVSLPRCLPVNIVKGFDVDMNIIKVAKAGLCLGFYGFGRVAIVEVGSLNDGMSSGG